jgi:hypothetical protein
MRQENQQEGVSHSLEIHDRTRRLILIPILHTQADMGSLGREFEIAARRQLGQEAWNRHKEALQLYWDEVERRLFSLTLPYARVRLYQDSLPVCGQEERIVQDAAQAGSRNYQILRKLMDYGATLMGTESVDLLMEEYSMARALVEAAARGEGPVQAAVARAERQRALLLARDSFIAERIQTTLEPGETGLLFLGALHAPETMLPPEIEVLRLTEIAVGKAEEKTWKNQEKIRKVPLEGRAR